MTFNEFYRKINSTVHQQSIYGWTPFYETQLFWCEDGSVLTNNSMKFQSIQEAKDYFISQQIINDIKNNTNTNITAGIVAGIIKDHYNIKVTDTLVESYSELVQSKIFTADPVAFDLKKKLTMGLIEGRYDYKLDDGSIVTITEATQTKINNIFGSHPNIVNFMRSSVDNFLTVVAQLEA